jgi:hypothetical protein
VLLTVAEELETCCNNIINQALGGTFASRPIPKYYPPHPYNPEKDSDGQAAGQMLSAKQENKPEKWTLQQEKGESWNKKHRLFLDAVIANDLHTVVEMVKVQEENACRNDFVSHVCLFSKDREKNQLDIDYVDINGISALYWSAIMGHAQIAQFLIPAGGNVHLRDLTGGTPLHAAAYQGNQTIVSLLIKVFFFFFFFAWIVAFVCVAQNFLFSFFEGWSGLQCPKQRWANSSSQSVRVRFVWRNCGVCWTRRIGM